MTAWFISRCSTVSLILNLQPSHATSIFDLTLNDYEPNIAAFDSQYSYTPPPVAYNHQPHPYPDSSTRTAEQTTACHAARIASPCLDQDTIPAWRLQSPVDSFYSSSSAQGFNHVGRREGELQSLTDTMKDLVERPDLACDMCGKAYKRRYALR